MLFVCKSFWHASMLAVKTPRRLHTARIDVKLCEDVADDAARPSMSSEMQKRNRSPKPESNQRPKDYYFAFSPMFGS